MGDPTEASVSGAPDDERQDPAEGERFALEPGRGRQATRPREVPVAGWRDIARRVAKEVRTTCRSSLQAWRSSGCSPCFLR